MVMMLIYLADTYLRTKCIIPVMNDNPTHSPPGNQKPEKTWLDVVNVSQCDMPPVNYFIFENQDLMHLSHWEKLIFQQNNIKMLYLLAIPPTVRIGTDFDNIPML